MKLKKFALITQFRREGEGTHHLYLAAPVKVMHAPAVK